MRAAADDQKIAVVLYATVELSLSREVEMTRTEYRRLKRLIKDGDFDRVDIFDWVDTGRDVHDGETLDVRAVLKKKPRRMKASSDSKQGGAS